MRGRPLPSLCFAARRFLTDIRRADREVGVFAGRPSVAKQGDRVSDQKGNRRKTPLKRGTPANSETLLNTFPSGAS
jgi:hypothetical protein